MYWYAWNIYLTDLEQPLTAPYAKGKFDVRIFSGEQDRETARTQLASVGAPLPDNFDARLNRGDALAIIYRGGEPVAFGWMTFTGGMEMAYGLKWILHANEGTQYGSFVLPKWRAQASLACECGAEHLCARAWWVRSVGSISVLNSQSLSMAKRWARKNS